MEKITNRKRSIGILLEGLPLHVRSAVLNIPDLIPLSLFLAIDGVAKLIMRHGRCNKIKEYELYPNGDIKSGEKTVIPYSTVAREITRTSKVHLEVAQKLVEWMFNAAQVQRHLFLGIKVTSVEEYFIRLELQKRNNATDLSVYWTDGIVDESIKEDLRMKTSSFSPLEIDLVLSRVTLAAAKAQVTITPNDDELEKVKQLQDVLAEQLEFSSISNRDLPKDVAFRDVLERNCVGYNPSHHFFGEADKDLLKRTYELLKALTEDTLSAEMGDQLMKCLYQLIRTDKVLNPTRRLETCLTAREDVIMTTKRIHDVREFSKLFKVNIPVPDEFEYYVATLSRSPEYSELDSQISAFKELERFAKAHDYRGARQYKLDHALPRMIEYCKKTDAYRQLVAAEHSQRQYRTKDELKRNLGSVLINIDIQSANFSALKKFDSSDELKGSWDALCTHLDIHPTLVLSKSFRQYVFGNTNPKRLVRCQHGHVLDMVDAMKSDQFPELQVTEDEIVFISYDEIILRLCGPDAIDHFGEHARRIVAALLSLNSVGGMPLHFEIFRLDKIEKPVYLKTVYELNGGGLNPAYRRLYGVPGNKFYRYFKTYVLREPLDERDLLFINDGELAKWIISSE